MGNEPFQLLSLMLQTKDYGANSGVVAGSSQLPGSGAQAPGRAGSSRRDVGLGKKAAFPAREVCRLRGLAFAGLNLTTFKWYDWDLGPGCCGGHRWEGM